MGSHLTTDGRFQSDKYPTTPAGKVPLSTKDPTAQDILWEYAQRRRAVDAEFSADLEQALINDGYNPRPVLVRELVRNANTMLEAAHFDERVPHAPTLTELRQILSVLTRGDVWRQEDEDALRAVINLYYEASRRSVEAGDEQTGTVLRHGD